MRFLAHLWHLETGTPPVAGCALVIAALAALVVIAFPVLALLR